MVQAAPYGTWTTPITTDLILSSSIGLDVVASTTAGVFWLEGRPAEKGRSAIVFKAHDGVAQDVIPAPFNARSRVQEYGGGALYCESTRVVFSDFGTNALYLVERSADGWSAPVQISPESKTYRFADISAHPVHPHLFLSILEDHTKPAPADVVTTLVLLDSRSKSFTTLAQGNDFYSSPRWSCKGDMVAYVTHNHPEMPWTKSSLVAASVEVGATGTILVHTSTVIASGNESVSQPRWESDGDRLVFLSDRTGYSELFVWDGKGEAQLVLEAATGSDVGSPDWFLGASTHRSLGRSEWVSKSKAGLRRINLDTKQSQEFVTPFDGVASLDVIDKDHIVVVASWALACASVSIVTLGETVSVALLKAASTAKFDEGYLSTSKAIVYPTLDGKGVSHGFYWAPNNANFVGVDGELPPLVVHCHGGPTSAASGSFKANIAFYTSQGFGYAEVNYGGSSGYGREFRERLNGNWGLVDVDDTIAAVNYLVSSGAADKQRVSIVGGSAGGYTVLAALCASKVFGAGVSLYGVSDIALLAADTHKFESHYMTGLMGGTLAEVPEVYKSRSPITNAAHITAPLLLLQGTDDKVVPPSQATLMKAAVPGVCDVIMFEGEGHGFRRADSSKLALESEIAWYRKAFGIDASN